MRMRTTPGVTIALVALVIGRHIDSPVITRAFGIDSSDAPPQFGPPEFNAPGFAPPALAPRTDGGHFNLGNWADDTKWQKYLDKGHHLACLMEATDGVTQCSSQDFTQSSFTSSKNTSTIQKVVADLIARESDRDNATPCDMEALGLRTAFEGHGLSSQPRFDDNGDRLDGSNECFKITHYDEKWEEKPGSPFGGMMPCRKQNYPVAGTEYPVTCPYYEFTVNIGANGGGIMATNIESPSHDLLGNMGWGRPANPGELPEFRTASDIFWGFWVRDNPNIKNFRMYAAQHIINPDTCLLVARAMKNKGVKKLSPWPGATFPIGTEEYTALIGSPIGATAAYFLATHKAELGIKRISKVTVVTNVKSPSKKRRLPFDMHIFFAVEDVPQDQVTKPGEDDSAVKRETGRKGLGGSMVVGGPSVTVTVTEVMPTTMDPVTSSTPMYSGGVEKENLQGAIKGDRLAAIGSPKGINDLLAQWIMPLLFCLQWALNERRYRQERREKKAAEEAERLRALPKRRASLP